MHKYSLEFSEGKKTVRAISKENNLSELEVIQILYEDKLVKLYEGSDIKSLLSEFSTMGELLILIEHMGSVFEIKSIFPKGGEGHGFYNLGKAPFSGHLDISAIANVAAVSENMFGRRSCYWNFLHKSGQSVMKVYLGRDENKELLKEQLEYFEKWS